MSQEYKPTIDYERLEPLYPKQREFVDCKKRITIVEASTKSGKTVGCLLWIFEQALRGKEGDNYWWIAPTFLTASIGYRRAKLTLKKSQLPLNYYKFNESNQTIHINNGATIWFKSGDNPDSLFGEDVKAAVIDEASRVSEDAWYAIRSTLTYTRGPIKIIGNVKGKSNWFYKLARKAEKGELSNAAYFKIDVYDSIDAGIIDKEEIEEAKQTLPEHVFNELYLVKPQDTGQNVFGNDAINNCITKISNNKAVCFGVDLARGKKKGSDFTSVIGLDDKCNVCFNNRYKGNWATQKNIISKIIKNTPTLVDETGVGSPITEDLQSICKNVEGFTFTNKSKIKLIEGLIVAIQQNTIGFPEGIITKELGNYIIEETRSGNSYTYNSNTSHDDTVISLSLAYSLWTELQYDKGGDIDCYVFSQNDKTRNKINNNFNNEWTTIYDEEDSYDF